MKKFKGAVQYIIFILLGMNCWTMLMMGIALDEQWSLEKYADNIQIYAWATIVLLVFISVIVIIDLLKKYK